MTLGFGTLFWLLGNALGLGAINLTSPVASGSLRAVTWVYDFVTLCVSFYIGGYGAARLGGFENRESSILHAVTMWGMVIVVTVAAGYMQNITFAQTINGFGTNAANWLLILTALVSCAATARGGQAGHARLRPFGISRPEAEHPSVEYGRRAA